MKDVFVYSLDMVEIVIDMGVALVNDVLDFLEFLNNELAAFKNINFDLNTLILYVTVTISLVY